MSGRISDIVIHPLKRHTWYVAVGSGGVWKTENAGTTWTPVFDAQPVVLDRLRHPRSVEPRDRLGGHGRERQRTPRRLRRRRLPEPERRQDLDEHGAREVRAHRADPGRPARSERRLRRGRGAALVGGRRARPLQDRGRRQDLDARPRDLEGHGRHVGRVRPRRSRHPLRRGLPAAPERRCVHGRRAGVGHPQERGRRQDLAQAHRGPAQGRRRQDRPGGLAARSARRLRHGRGRAGGEGLLPVGRPGRKLGEAQRLHQRRDGAPLLSGDLRRPDRLRPRLPDGPGPQGDGRRRQDLAPRRRGEQARRQPRHGLRQGRPRLHPQRQRRRRLRDARRRARPGAFSRTCR